ncbi:MAG: HipA N-terminal domain-containing protein [Simkania negevensis]|nr:HipA N-terminal domain-containing protein [Simkania negevensis]
MKKARVFVDGELAGVLEEIKRSKQYRFTYLKDYKGPAVSLTMPTDQEVHEFDQFPSFFEGLLPEGVMLESLLRHAKLDQHDMLGQLIVVGQDLVGNVTVEAAE